MLRPLASTWFQGLFHSSVRGSFTFPSRYWFTIGLWGVFSLSGWSRQFHTGFLVSRATQDTARNNKLTCTGLSPSAGALSNALPIRFNNICRSPTTPYWPQPIWFGLFRVRSPLLAESLLFSFPPGNEMFQFPGFAFCYAE